MDYKCKKCYKRKPLEKFGVNRALKSGHSHTCKTCTRKRDREFYVRGRGDRKNKNLYEHNRAYFLRVAGGRCEKCGYNERVDILEFDHIIPRKARVSDGKTFANRLRICSIKNPSLWDEWHNIQVLCPNCHRIKTRDNKEHRQKLPREA